MLMQHAVGVQHVGKFIGEFEADVTRELLVDDNDPAQPSASKLFHRCAPL